MCIITGLPRTPRLTSSPAGGEKSSYTLTWETESHTPVIMYRLQYRKRKVGLSTLVHLLIDRDRQIDSKGRIDTLIRRL